MSWYRITLSHEDVVAGKLGAIQDAFAEVWMRLRAPKSAALFSRDDDDGGGVALYFSPQAAKIFGLLIAANHGSACERPPAQGTALLVGNGDPVRDLLGG